MIRTVIAASLICLASSACSETTRVEDDLAQSQGDAENPTGRTTRVDSNPGERPVRIGEGGPRFDACQSIGKVAGLRSGELDVLIAPFDSASKKDSLKAGDRVYICTRSHDQQWFGIVYAGNAPAKVAAPVQQKADDDASPQASPTQVNDLGDCGVSSPVRTKRNYGGPCKSGWVASNFVKLIAG